MTDLSDLLGYLGQGPSVYPDVDIFILCGEIRRIFGSYATAATVLGDPSYASAV